MTAHVFAIKWRRDSARWWLRFALITGFVGVAVLVVTAVVCGMNGFFLATLSALQWFVAGDAYARRRELLEEAADLETERESA